MGTFEDMLASGRATGCTELTLTITLRFGVAPSTPAVQSSAVPSVASASPTAPADAESLPTPEVGPVTPPLEQTANAPAIAQPARRRHRNDDDDEPEDDEDMYAASGARPANILELMDRCDEEALAWRSEQAQRAIQPTNVPLLVARPPETTTQ